MSSIEPAISVVVPTFNRCERLHRVLTSLANQEVAADYEVIVVSDGSTDGTDEYLRSEQLPLPVVAVTQENQGPAATRNHGVQRARGRLILFLDDDVVADPGLLQAHLDAHARFDGGVVVIGPMLDPPDHAMTSWVVWEQRMLAKQYQAMEKGKYAATARQFYTGNASLLRADFDAAGGFDSRFRRAEDVELAFRLDDNGLAFRYEPRAVGLHYAERSHEAWIDTARVYGHNDVVFARDLGHRFIYGVIRESYSAHHFTLRVLTQLALASGPIDCFVTRRLAALVEAYPEGRRRKIMGYVLSAQYCLEYHRGVTEELGSVRDFRRLVIFRRSPS
ncbi:MAG: glycosyltransferase family 2 protein [Ilumatobacteraceae bacterium]|nr:glycosyltransferase family 2 protein [Ilumatobacteraceae bacterium]